MTRLPEPLRLSYVIGRYPVLTETFIDREIQHLLDHGVDLEIVSIRRHDDNLSPAQRDLSQRVRYLLPPSIPSLALAHLTALFGRPRTYLGTLAWLLSRPHRNASHARTAAHFATGIYVAWVLRRRHGIHLHAHFVDRAATVAMVAARFLDTTYSVTAHAQEIYVNPHMLRERLQLAAFVATCTEYNRAHLAGVVGHRDAGKIVRLYHGLPLSELGNGTAPAVADPPLLLSVAQLTERKGLQYLVRACGRLRDAGIAFRCEIVGDGPVRGALAALIHELHLEDGVVLTGPLPYLEVVARYARASAFVLPCIIAPNGDRDGIPNVILEAMAAGVPVVSTPVSGIPEVIHDDVTGLMVPEADVDGLASAITRLLGDAELRLRLGREARLFVEREFDMTRNLDRLMDQFRALPAVADPA
ncbi:MAG TPA: glycosyltransferase [Candidatus Limnocylindria bacterium]